jgi:uncharacterized protein (UPF0548 family)
MKNPHIPTGPLVISLIVSFATSAFAEPHTIEPTDFAIHHSITARALPAKSELISLNAAHWSAFEITRLAAHGATVKKGDVLIAFDAEPFQKALTDLERAIARRELEIASARLELANLTATAETRLAASRRAAAESANDHEYYTATRHAVDIEAAKEEVKRAEQRLNSIQEELKQLLRMYDEDDLVEETEEIILTRQREAIASAEFALRVEKLDQQRRTDTTLPRHIETLREAKEDTARQLATAEQEIPRAITLKQADLATLEITQKRDQENLAKLQADRACFEITAPANGTFYHGPMVDGEWTTGELVKSLVISGRPPVKKPLATFVPADTPLVLHAFLAQSAALSFGGEKPSGSASLAGREDVAIPVTLTSLAPAPNPDGLHHAVFTAQWPKGHAATPGATATIQILSYSKPAAIVVPAKALAFGANGWYVPVKLADGKTEKRPVTRGRISGDEVEILQGLEAGQVILLP